MLNWDPSPETGFEEEKGKESTGSWEEGEGHGTRDAGCYEVPKAGFCEAKLTLPVSGTSRDTEFSALANYKFLFLGIAYINQN